MTATPHPVWCAPVLCDVAWTTLPNGARVAQGEHRRATAATQRTGEGRDVQVGLTGETPGEAQDLRVTVRLAANRDEVLADLRHAVDGD